VRGRPSEDEEHGESGQDAAERRPLGAPKSASGQPRFEFQGAFSVIADWSFQMT
jgi:hypothetical protein